MMNLPVTLRIAKGSDIQKAQCRDKGILNRNVLPFHFEDK